MAGEKDLNIKIEMENRSGHGIDDEKIKFVAAAVLKRLGCRQGELGVTFVGAGEMEKMNAAYMGREGLTDVLSFPLDAMGAPTARDEEVPLLLGDVVICPDAVEEGTPELEAGFMQEICLLLVHGILHLAGYDHETDRGEMDLMQKQLFEELCK